MRPELQTSSRLFLSQTPPHGERGEGLSKSYCGIESTRELLRYYEQMVPRTCGADVRARRARSFYPQGNESKTEPSS